MEHEVYSGSTSDQQLEMIGCKGSYESFRIFETN
jgi:hypothetical protein